MMMERRWFAAIGGLLLVAGCGSSSEGSADTAAPVTEPAPATEPAPVATEAPATTPDATTPDPTTPDPTTPDATTTLAPTTTAAPTTTEPPPAIVIGEPDADGVIAVSIDGARLAPLFDEFMDGADPLYLVHTQQDDIFVGVELYTVFGSGWTGELGTFPADCTTHGICVYLDPDGIGPLPGGGPAGGELTVVQLEGGSIITIDDATIVADDGTVYTLSGVTLTG